MQQAKVERVFEQKLAAKTEVKSEVKPVVALRQQDEDDSDSDLEGWAN